MPTWTSLSTLLPCLDVPSPPLPCNGYPPGFPVSSHCPPLYSARIVSAYVTPSSHPYLCPHRLLCPPGPSNSASMHTRPFLPTSPQCLSVSFIHVTLYLPIPTFLPAWPYMPHRSLLPTSHRCLPVFSVRITLSTALIALPIRLQHLKGQNIGLCFH